MLKPTTSHLILLLASVIGLIATAIGAFLFIGWPTETKDVTYGVTFSAPYAQSLGLDPEHVLTVALDEIGIRRFRIPAYWKTLEPTQGTWDFSSVDQELSDISQRKGTVVLAVGEKLPRWPECWQPDWWKKLSTADQEKTTLNYLETVVTRYRDNPTINAWQVENEPHFSYGDCKETDPNFLKEEIALVRGLDPTRPVYTTDSGELSLWLLGSEVDKLGVSVYRVVRNPMLGKFNVRYWFVPPYLYERKADILKLFGLKDLYVSEFQMEPWSNTDLPHTAIDDQLSSMNLTQMQSNFWFAQHMGIHTIDFWGLEWWVWMNDKWGHPEFLQAAEAFWKNQAH
ncbi:MAG: hypothetical protein WA001_02865 [Patescibacteria group bacterium]